MWDHIFNQGLFSWVSTVTRVLKEPRQVHVSRIGCRWVWTVWDGGSDWFWGAGLVTGSLYWISYSLASICALHPINACDLLMVWCVSALVCVCVCVWGTPDFLSLWKSHVWKQREHLLSSCTLLWNHKVQMTPRPPAAQRRLPARPGPARPAEERRGGGQIIRAGAWSKTPQCKQAICTAVPVSVTKAPYACPSTDLLIDGSVSCGINDSFGFHKSRCSAPPKPLPPTPPKTPPLRLWHIIRSVLPIMGHFSAGINTAYYYIYITYIYSISTICAPLWAGKCRIFSIHRKKAP